MIHDAANGRTKHLVDAQGRKICKVKTFNDETNEAEIYLSVEEKGRVAMAAVIPPSEDLEAEWAPVLVKVIIPGARIVDREDV